MPASLFSNLPNETEYLNQIGDSIEPLLLPADKSSEAWFTVSVTRLNRMELMSSGLQGKWFIPYKIAEPSE